MIKTCKHCGDAFDTHKKNRTLCSEACKKANQKRMNREYAQRNAEKHAETSRVWRKNLTQEKRDAINAERRCSNAVAYEDTRLRAKELKPVLDAIELTPDNIPIITEMVEYIEQDARLAYLLDWYWLSDAKEYLDEQQ